MKKCIHSFPTPFLLPYLGCVFLFWLIPICSGAWMSLHSGQLTGQSSFVGLKHYLTLLADSTFHRALINTLLFAIGLAISVIPLALVLARCIQNIPKRLKPFFLFSLILPGLTPPSVLAILFLLVFYGKHGLLNGILITPLGFESINWLKDPDFILLALLLQGIWRWTGFMTLFIHAGLECIPRQYYEMALLESKPSWLTFRSITLPALRKVLCFCCLYLIIDASITFSGAYLLLGASGGPDNAGLLIVSYAYQQFHFGASAAAAAMAFIISPFLLCLLWLLILYQPRRVVTT